MELHKKYLTKGYCKGLLDFPCSDEVARQLEQDIKTAEAEGLTYQRSFVCKSVSDFDEGERADISIITDQSIDRDNEVVIAKGVDYKSFKKNPIVAFAHRYDILPVGRAAWIRTEGDNIKAKTIYAKMPDGFPVGLDFFPESVWALVKQGFLPGKSIGFMPLEASSPTTKEIEQRPELASARKIIRKSSLYEYSIAPVPANQNALAQAVSKGLGIPELLRKALGIKDEEELEAEIKACIVWNDDDYLPEIRLPKQVKCVELQDDFNRMLDRIRSADDLYSRITGRL